MTELKKGMALMEKFYTEPELGFARELRDAALDQVSGSGSGSEEWMGLALAAIGRLRIKHEVTGEDVQRAIIHGVGSPHTPKVWGALINTARHKGLLYKTGKIGQMKKASSHAHNSPLYLLTRRNQGKKAFWER